MGKQTDFNVDMDKYLVKKKQNSNGSGMSKSKKQKQYKTVSEMYPDLCGEGNEVHVIESESNVKKLLNEYKCKILSMLKKEEEEIENIELSDDKLKEDALEELEEVTNEIEDTLEENQEEEISFIEKFKRTVANIFMTEKEVEEEEYEEQEEETPEEIEEEFEELETEEEEVEKQSISGWFKGLFVKLGLSGENEENVTPGETEEEEKNVTKVILYKARIEKDVKLALMIADKYIRNMPAAMKESFKKSGDQVEFEEALTRLKIK